MVQINTELEKKIIEAYSAIIQESNKIPSIREIQKRVGSRSTSNMQNILARLKLQGRIGYKITFIGSTNDE